MKTERLCQRVLVALLFGALCYSSAIRWQGIKAQSPTFNIRQLPLLTNDLVYHAATNRIYASVPSAAGRPYGNSIVALDPARGEVLATVYAGSEPGKMALSADGQQLYVTLDGAAAIRRIELGSFTAGAQITLGKNAQDGPLYAQGLAVVPGQPQTLVVARGVNPNDSELVVFDQQTPRAQTVRSFNGGVRAVVAPEGNRVFAFETGSFSEPGLSRLTLDNSGLTVAQRVSGLLPNGDDFRLLRGKLFSTSGRVINTEPLAAAGTLGDFGAGNAITTDEAANRIYLLTGGGSTRTLRAFEANSLAQLGALDVAGINGTSSSLIRWGTNGLAFRTSARQVFLVQTFLVSANQPIPVVTPLPTPSPTPTPAFNLRSIPLAANDLAYDAQRGLLYASVPSFVGTLGNSIIPIDPATGVVGAPLWAGSEPGKLAVSDNGQFLYIALDGSRSVRRFDLATRTFSAPFPVLATLTPNDSQFGTFYQVRVSAMQAVPGKPEAVALVKSRPNAAPSFDAVEIYDNGVRRNKIYVPGFGGPGSIAFGASAERLYGNDLEVSNGFYQLTANTEGVTGQVTSRGYAGGDIAFHEGLVYAANGQIVDPESLTLRGRLNASGSPFLLDPAGNRAYFMGGASFATTRTMTAIELDTLWPVGTHSLPNVGTNASSLVRWGTNGLAFRTTNQIVLLQSHLVTTSVPITNPTPVPPLPPSPTPAPVTVTVRSVDVPANDLAYDSVARVLYASVPMTGGTRASTLTPIVPETGAIRNAIPLNANPDRLVISRDSRAIFIASRAPNARVRRFDTVTQSLGEPFALTTNSSTSVRDMEVVPGDANALVVLREDNTLAVYDSGVARPQTTNGSVTLRELEFGATAANLYGHENNSNSALYKLTLSPSGISLARGDAIGGLINFPNSQMRFESGLLYTNFGQVFDPEARQPRGVYGTRASGLSPPEVVSASSNNRVLFFTTTQFGTEFVLQIQVFDQQTFLPLQAITVPNVPGQASHILRWGNNGLAMLAGNRVYLLNLSLLDATGSGNPVTLASVSAASFQPVLAPNSLAVAFGTQLAETTQSAATLPLPTTLAGTRVSLRSSAGGQEQPASLLFVSPTQINYLLPQFLPPGQTTLLVTTAAGQTFVSTLQLETVAPGLFAANANGQGVAAALALRVRADGSQSYESLAQFDAAQSRFVARPLDLGPATDQVFLILFGTGWRQRSALNNVNVTLGGTALPVLFAGAQGDLAGLDQINVALPRTLTGRGDLEVALTVDGKAANPVRINIK